MGYTYDTILTLLPKRYGKEIHMRTYEMLEVRRATLRIAFSVLPTKTVRITSTAERTNNDFITAVWLLLLLLLLLLFGSAPTLFHHHPAAAGHWPHTFWWAWAPPRFGEGRGTCWTTIYFRTMLFNRPRPVGHWALWD